MITLPSLRPQTGTPVEKAVDKIRQNTPAIRFSGEDRFELSSDGQAQKSLRQLHARFQDLEAGSIDKRQVLENTPERTRLLFQYQGKPYFYEEKRSGEEAVHYTLASVGEMKEPIQIDPTGILLDYDRNSQALLVGAEQNFSLVMPASHASRRLTFSLLDHVRDGLGLTPD